VRLLVGRLTLLAAVLSTSAHAFSLPELHVDPSANGGSSNNSLHLGRLQHQYLTDGDHFWTPANVQSLNQTLIAHGASPVRIAKSSSTYAIDRTANLAAHRFVDGLTRAHYPLLSASPADLEAFKFALTTSSVDAFIAQLRNEHSLLGELRRHESIYSAIVDSGDWPRLSGAPVVFDDFGVDVEKLRARLSMEGYNSGSGFWFDEDLKFALIRYQQVQGLNTTGKLDAPTRAALNVPASTRLRTIRANINRFASLPPLTADDRVIVNIASAEAEYFNDRRRVWNDVVIVGKKDRPTPELNSAINTLVFNPTWFVPTKLAYRDVFPRALRDESYWDRMGYRAFAGAVEVFPTEPDVDLKQLMATQHLRVQQSPGPANALGQVKFLFPNSYAVYLHDTPNRSLFERDKRTFSSGCVRVNDPLRFAGILLKKQEGQMRLDVKPQQIGDVVASAETTRVELTNPVEVSTIYLTAEPLPTGELRFHADVYANDRAG